MRDGGDFSTATAMAYDAARTENEALHKKVEELTGQPSTGTPVVMTSAKGTPAPMFKTGK